MVTQVHIHSIPGARNFETWIRHECVCTCVTTYLARPCTGHNVYAVTYMCLPQGNDDAPAFNLLDWSWLKSSVLSELSTWNIWSPLTCHARVKLQFQVHFGSGHDLTCRNFTCPVLTFLHLNSHDLNNLDLTCPDLTFADLTCPNFAYPDLTCPDLTCPDLTCPYLTCPDFTYPYLTSPVLPFR